MSEHTQDKSFWRYLFSLGKIDGSRLEWIDYAKGIAITMIVYRHLNTGLWDAGVSMDPLFYDLSVQIGLTFRMPLYFLLSGIFFYRSYSKRGLKGYTIHKFNTIMYPYFIWSIILMLIQMSLQGYVNAQFDSITDFLIIFYSPWGHWWFLYVLFVVSVLYMMLFALFKGSHIWLALIGLALYSLNYWITDYYLIDNILELFIYFVIGDVIAKIATNVDQYPFLFKRHIIIPAVTLTIIGEYLLFMYWRDDPLAKLVFATLGSLTVSALCVLLSRLKLRAGLVLRLIGQHSLYIYLLHALTSAGVRVILFKIMGIENLIILEVMGFFAGLIGPILLYRVINYFGGIFLFQPKLARA